MCVTLKYFSFWCGWLQIKESMHNANRDHKATLARMEQKFFEEKVSLSGYFKKDCAFFQH